MLESMTGSGRSSVAVAGNVYHISIRSVNHKFLEISCRLPSFLRTFEEEWKSLIQREVARGHVDLEIQSRVEYSRPFINQKALHEYRKLLGITGKHIPPATMLELLKLPGILSVDGSIDPDFPSEKLFHGLHVALGKLRKARLREGRELEVVFRRYLRHLKEHAKKIERLHARSRKEIAKKIEKELVRKLTGKRIELSENGERTILEWYDRGEIAEELERLAIHVKAMLEIIDSSVDAGKRLEFYSQELLREINTIGSKSRDAQIRSHVVDMKNIVEKIKEQVRNIC